MKIHLTEVSSRPTNEWSISLEDQESNIKMNSWNELSLYGFCINFNCALFSCPRPPEFCLFCIIFETQMYRGDSHSFSLNSHINTNSWIGNPTLRVWPEKAGLSTALTQELGIKSPNPRHIPHVRARFWGYFENPNVSQGSPNNFDIFTDGQIFTLLSRTNWERLKWILSGL